MKAVKNPVEILGMEAAHTRDAVALCQFLQYLDEHVSFESRYYNIARTYYKFNIFSTNRSGNLGTNYGWRMF